MQPRKLKRRTLQAGTAGLLAGATALAGAGIASACPSGNPSSSDIQSAQTTAFTTTPNSELVAFLEFLKAAENAESQADASPTAQASGPSVNYEAVALYAMALEKQEGTSQPSSTQSGTQSATDTSKTDDSNHYTWQKCDGDNDGNDQGCAATASNSNSANQSGDARGHDRDGQHVNDH